MEPATLCHGTKSVAATLFTFKSVAKTSVDFQALAYVYNLLATLLHFCFGFFVELSAFCIFTNALKIHKCPQTDKNV